MPFELLATFFVQLFNRYYYMRIDLIIQLFFPSVIYLHTWLYKQFYLRYYEVMNILLGGQNHEFY